MSDVTVVSCPTCGKPVVWGKLAFRPFCSKRCQLVIWANGRREKRIASGGDQSDSGDWAGAAVMALLRRQYRLMTKINQ